ncbi:alpha/beta hydrolase [Nonomuraea zeae]|uniref:Enterochelin esterase n=1 Tax=Nonomuraea zeae TaxID=1642303 RepID=A0A5S4FFW8_9ACTN|nr:alpha/beta hydrolase-fold protein [Nonomuraea zeae]TMR17946.1 enterochelin esterase [Nonomuraea zeae]
MLPWAFDLAGRIDHHTVDSALLRGNPLGDPSQRPLWVYVPPGYDNDHVRHYPVVYVIQGYGGHLTMWANRTPFRQPYPELVDAMFARGDAPPAIVVYVDAWTSLGGSQFLDSPGTGRYHSYLCDEIVPWVDAHYRTIAHRNQRAITGKSSGGYGAMITPMLRPDLFGALATHAGDALFEVCYQFEFRSLTRTLRDHYNGSIDQFLTDFRSRIVGTKPANINLISMYGYAAAYSADEDGTVHLPFDTNGAIKPDIWQRWLQWDPVRMAAHPTFAEALASMQAIWIDAGTSDEWYLDLGATAFHQAVTATGLPADRVHFELFDAGHKAIEYRYPLALAWLCERMTSPSGG